MSVLVIVYGVLKTLPQNPRNLIHQEYCARMAAFAMSFCFAYLLRKGLLGK
jgi:hypothetical protein